MAYELRDQSGTLFKNGRKTQPNQPDYGGDAMVNGVKVRMSAWVKRGAKGKFMSLAFSPPRDEQRQAAPVERAPAIRAERDAMDDEIPF